MTPPVRPEPIEQDDPLAAYRAFKAKHAKDATAHLGEPFVNAKPDTSETPGDRAAGLISAGYQGLTLGAGNKITAGIRTVLPRSMGGVDFSPGGFRQALQEQTNVLDTERQRHPAASLVTELAGGIPTMLVGGGAGALKEAPTFAGRLLDTMATGAGFGATTGAAEAIRPGATVEDVGHGAEAGAAIGATAGPIVSRVAAPLVRGGVRLAARVFPSALADRLASAVGAKPISPRGQAGEMMAGSLERGGVDLGEAAKGVDVREVAQQRFPATQAQVEDYAKTKGITTDEAAKRMRAAGYQIGPAVSGEVKSPPTTVMEQGSEGVSRLVRTARNVPGSTAAQETDRFLTERAAGAGNRIQSALSEATGHDPVDVLLPTEQVIEKRATEAKPLYQEAHDYGEIQDPETVQQINTLRSDPVFARAWRRGQALLDLEAGNKASPELQSAISPERLAELKRDGLDKYLPASVRGGPGGNPTVQQIDYWKQGLDATIEASRGSENALSRQEARVYRQKLNQVLARVDEEVPAYKKARASFRGNSELMDAAEAGANHFKPGTPTGALERQMADLSPGEREVYVNNALNALADKIHAMAGSDVLPEANKGRDIMKVLFGGHTEDRLGMLFPTEEAFDRFVSRVEDEPLYIKTERALRGQSTTAQQLADAAATPATWAARVAGAVAHPKALAVRAVASMASKKPGMAVETANEIGSMATKTGNNLRLLLEELKAGKEAREAGRQRLNTLLTGEAAEGESESRAPKPPRQFPRR